MVRQLLQKLTGKKSPIQCSAVVVAAGGSTRMGFDKIFTDVGGEPALIRCLRTFEAAPSVEEIVVVVREEALGAAARLCREAGLTKVTKIVRGGDTRTRSARLGTLEVKHKAKLIAVHDGARPFVTVDVIEDAVAQAAVGGAAAPALPVKDTVKRVGEDGFVAETLDRDTLWAIQTPQVFDGDLIRAALQKAIDDGAELTDDCAAVERLGMKVALVPGDERNIKLTTPVDLAVAKTLMEEYAQ